MLYAVLFTDDPDRAGVRQQLMSAHLDFLEQQARSIRAAGPLLDDGGAGAGGLWLVEADSHEAVLDLVKEDPFWPTGLRATVHVLRWNQVFADGCRIVRH